MDGLEFVYLVSFFLGLGFAILSGLFSGVFSGAEGGVGDMDVSGGLDMDAGVDHDAPGGAAVDGTVHFPVLSPVTIAMFIACFGGVGLITKKLGWEWYAQIPVASLSGLVGAGLVFYVFYKVFSVTGGSSAEKMEEIIGTEAQVITGSTLDGVGEISYAVGSSRRTAPGRASDGKEIGKQSVVKIAKIVGNIYYVERVT